MFLRDIDFGPIWDACGLRGFRGEGYAHHAVTRGLGMTLEGMTPVFKTVTARPNAGNMPLREDSFRPKKFKPDCIVTKFRHGAMLNAVGLSNPGVAAVLATDEWQMLNDAGEPFFCSFGHAAGTTPEERMDDTETFVSAMLTAFPVEGLRQFGVQFNAWCPNARNKDALLDETAGHITLLARLGIPIVLKTSATMEPADAMALAEHEAVDAICTTNALPWGSFPNVIPWRRIFGSDESPLARYGGGAYSGPELVPINVAWLRALRELGFAKLVNAGGGIRTEADLEKFVGLAQSVSTGSLHNVRPHRSRRLIRAAYRLFR